MRPREQREKVVKLHPVSPAVRLRLPKSLIRTRTWFDSTYSDSRISEMASRLSHKQEFRFDSEVRSHFITKYMLVRRRGRVGGGCNPLAILLSRFESCHLHGAIA